MWFTLATTVGDEDAVKNRDLIARQLTSRQLAEAQRLATQCYAQQFKGC
jgi:hypothetical protein